MNVALLINERAIRHELTTCPALSGAIIDEFPTAAKALGRLVSRPYDLVVLHWKVHPGFAAGDSRIDELAFLIPRTQLNRNVLYWEVALRVLDRLRAEESCNRNTPVLVLLPTLGRFTFETGDQLSRESVEFDLARRQPARAFFGHPTPGELVQALQANIDKYTTMRQS